MNKRQINAKLKKDQRLLDESIAHWKRLAACNTRKAVRNEGWGFDECALCEEYYDRNRCYGCPVAFFSCQSGCRETPYEDVAEGLVDYRDGYDSFPIAEVRAQLNFLRRVRKALG